MRHLFGAASLSLVWLAWWLVKEAFRSPSAPIPPSEHDGP